MKRITRNRLIALIADIVIAALLGYYLGIAVLNAI